MVEIKTNCEMAALIKNQTHKVTFELSHHEMAALVDGKVVTKKVELTTGQATFKLRRLSDSGWP